MRLVTVALAALVAGCSASEKEVVTTDSAGGEVASEVQGAFVINLSEWKVDSPMDTLPAGKYTFRVENSGTMPHALEIEGNGKEYETGDVKPGTASELTVDLAPGTYELYCPVEAKGMEHDKRGMTRTLVVKPV